MFDLLEMFGVFNNRNVHSILAVRILRAIGTVRSTRCSLKLFEIFAKSKVFGLFSVWTVRCAESCLKLTVRNDQNGNAKEDDTVSSGSI